MCKFPLQAANSAEMLQWRGSHSVKIAFQVGSYLSPLPTGNTGAAFGRDDPRAKLASKVKSDNMNSTRDCGCLPTPGRSCRLEGMIDGGLWRWGGRAQP